jgi:hypothetical protein
MSEQEAEFARLAAAVRAFEVGVQAWAEQAAAIGSPSTTHPQTGAYLGLSRGDLCRLLYT